jgi:nucleoside-diphosphate-sugar epimerase
MTEPLIAKGSTILVTGANSFIANHIADQLLTDGYNVRGTVRSQSKGEELQQYFDDAYGIGKFQLIIVEGITSSDAFDRAIKGKLVHV